MPRKQKALHQSFGAQVSSYPGRQASSPEPLLSLDAFPETMMREETTNEREGILPVEIFGAPRLQWLDGLRQGTKGTSTGRDESGRQSDERARRRDRADARCSHDQAFHTISSFVLWSRMFRLLSRRRFTAWPNEPVRTRLGSGESTWRCRSSVAR